MVKTKLWIGVFISALWLSGCGDHLTSGDGQSAMEEGGLAAGTGETQETRITQGGTQEPAAYIEISSAVAELESGFSAVRFEGDDGFVAFLNQGGAESDREVLQFLTGTMLGSAEGLSFEGDAFGCSTISVENTRRLLFRAQL